MTLNIACCDWRRIFLANATDCDTIVVSFAFGDDEDEHQDLETHPDSGLVQIWFAIQMCGSLLFAFHVHMDELLFYEDEEVSTDIVKIAHLPHPRSESLMSLSGRILKQTGLDLC